MILSKNQLDMFYDTISQSSPNRMDEKTLSIVNHTSKVRQKKI